MLSPQQIESLRAKVRAADSRPLAGPWKRATFDDGPLAGLTVRLESGAFAAKDATVGWCQATNNGPVVARYSHSATLGRLRFDGIDYPGGRQSGRWGT